MLMTGRHLGHTTIRGNDGAYTPLLPTDVTVAKVLKDAGYVTGEKILLTLKLIPSYYIPGRVYETPPIWPTLKGRVVFSRCL